MPTIEINYQGQLRTLSQHLASGAQIITDAPLDNKGKGEAFSPTDLLCASLGCCMLTIMGIAAETHQINIEGTKIRITKIMAANPRRVSEIQVEIIMAARAYPGHQKDILERAAKTCPVALSLHPDIYQNVTFLFSE